MYEALRPVEPDPILELAVLFRVDPRPDKLDLGIGVFKTSDGRVPILASVKEAEHRLMTAETTKNYVGLAGNEEFNAAIARLVLGEDFLGREVRGVQAVGGQGAIRLLLELVHHATPNATVWISNPSWTNHATVANRIGLNTQLYRYYDALTGRVDFDGMMANLATAKPGDILLLHGCCHNPTGADLDSEQWKTVVALCNRAQVVPLVDTAYQGLGIGLTEDVAGLRLLAAEVPELLIAYSCSKNFGLYRDRAGCAMVVGSSAVTVDLAKSRLMAAARANYSMPPNHSAAVASLVLSDPLLKSQWEQEVQQMRSSLATSRSHIVSALRLRTGSNRYDYIAQQKGLFSLLGLSQDQVARLRSDFGIFVVGNSRINVAGVGEEEAIRLADAVSATTNEV